MIKKTALILFLGISIYSPTTLQAMQKRRGKPRPKKVERTLTVESIRNGTSSIYAKLSNGKNLSQKEFELFEKTINNVKTSKKSLTVIIKDLKIEQLSSFRNLFLTMFEGQDITSLKIKLKEDLSALLSAEKQEATLTITGDGAYYILDKLLKKIHATANINIHREATENRIIISGIIPAIVWLAIAYCFFSNTDYGTSGPLICAVTYVLILLSCKNKIVKQRPSSIIPNIVNLLEFIEETASLRSDPHKKNKIKHQIKFKLKLATPGSKKKEIKVTCGMETFLDSLISFDEW